MKGSSGVFSIRIPYTLIGSGVAGNIGTVVKNMGAKKVLIVTDKGISSTDLPDKITQPLQEAGIEFGIFDGGQPDAPLSVITDCAKFASEGGYDSIVGLGGGSMIDIVKVASVLAVTGEEVHNLFTEVKRAGLPKIQIPTTAGTGAEWSRAAVVTDDLVDGNKKVIRSDYLIADTVIIDPQLTLNLPQKVTADSGIDALVHAIEAYTTWKANVGSDMFAGQAIELVANNLREAYAKGSKNIEARYNMSIAASLAAAAASIMAAAGLVHAMGHSLQGTAHCTHGVSVSVMLPHVMEFNMLADLPKFARLAQLMGEKTEGLPLREAAQKAADAARKLSIDVGMPQKLRDIGLSKEDIPKIIDIMFTTQIPLIDANARDCSREDAIKIFEAAW